MKRNLRGSEKIVRKQIWDLVLEKSNVADQIKAAKTAHDNIPNIKNFPTFYGRGFPEIFIEISKTVNAMKLSNPGLFGSSIPREVSAIIPHPAKEEKKSSNDQKIESTSPHKNTVLPTLREEQSISSDEDVKNKKLELMLSKILVLREPGDINKLTMEIEKNYKEVFQRLSSKIKTEEVDIELFNDENHIRLNFNHLMDVVTTFADYPDDKDMPAVKDYCLVKGEVIKNNSYNAKKSLYKKMRSMR